MTADGAQPPHMLDKRDLCRKMLLGVSSELLSCYTCIANSFPRRQDECPERLTSSRSGQERGWREDCEYTSTVELVS